MTYSLKALNGHRSTIAYQRVALEATLEVTLEPQPSYPGAPAQLPWRLPWSPNRVTLEPQPSYPGYPGAPTLDRSLGSRVTSVSRSRLGKLNYAQHLLCQGEVGLQGNQLGARKTT